MAAISKHFFSILTSTSLLLSCSSQENSNQKNKDTSISTLKLAHVAIETDPLSLDPRMVRDLGSINLMNALFEGLVKTGIDQKPEFALAESVDVSPDLKTYTFTLREAKWSDGTPLTAADFAETWKSTLDPAFPAPTANMLFVIKGAKAVKDGSLPIQDIGIKATSPKTLVVELEQPSPYFLTLLTDHSFFPVNASMRSHGATPLITTPEKLISNGPFKISKWKQRDQVVVSKNPHYWNANAIALEGIAFQVIDENTALQLFKGGKLDWVGSPMSILPQDSIKPLKETGSLKIAPAAGTHWIRFNTKKAPFDNVNMRKAFNSALDRKSIVEHITQGNQHPAIGVIPPSMRSNPQEYYKDNDVRSAQKYYMAALIDFKNNGEKVPEISLCYSGNDRNRKVSQAIQQQWNKAFGVTVALESCESQVFYDKLRNGTYQLALGSWYADVLDPINFLEIFKTKELPTNNTFWENTQFAQLLEMSAHEHSPEERGKLLSQAEAILMEELPVAPLYHGSFNYVVSPRLEGVRVSESGIMNFTNASIKE